MSVTAGQESMWAKEERKAFTRLQYLNTSPTEMSFPTSRATSPSSLVPFRFGSHTDNQQQWKGEESRNTSFFGSRSRRVSTPSKLDDKGKGTARGKDSARSISPTSTSNGFADSFLSSRYNSSFTSPETSRPSTADGGSNSLKKAKGGFLAASDALAIKFGRKRPPVRQPPMPIMLPEVIEISAHQRDAEVEERNRLRDMAAIAIGLPVMKVDNQSVEESPEEEEAQETEASGTGEADNHDSNSKKNWESISNVLGRSPHGSNLSIIPSPALPNRYRSGSLLAHSRTNSVTLGLVPPFPTNLTALNSFKQSTTVLHKYYSPSSLRIFALSKNWRARFMVFSSPTALAARGSGPPVSYLHLFKSSTGDEKELERLEINEESVVFVAEEDVGGRKHVVKVGGVDVGALKKEWIHEEGGKTMWFLHIADPTEAQNWISIIKNAILGQRAMRAGLGLPDSTLAGIEPKGDMDVMLSMRAQGLITSPTSATARQSTPPQTPVQPDRHYASSISSRRSQATVSRPISPGPVSVLKGLLTGSTRPRSASRAASIESERGQHDRESRDESFASMGSRFLDSGVRPSTGDAIIGSSQSVMTHASLPFSSLSTEQRLERKIVTDRPIYWSSNDVTPISKERANKALSLGTLSLQPPPRKRWTSVGPTTSSIKDVGMYRNANGNSSRTGSLAIDGSHEKADIETPASPSLAGFSFGTPEQRPRAPSIQSVSTLASGDHAPTLERSSSSTKRSSVRRWSRQGGVLPQRLTPPGGPPPSIPSNQSSPSNFLPHPYAEDRPPSQISSTHSDSSQRSFVSSLPSFSKRASGSSALSVNTSSTSQSSPSRPTSTYGHRTSMPPPPRPAPTLALPPAPDQDSPKSEPPSSSKSSFRDSVAHRTFRMSMIAPKPPPSTVLPPRPDELEYRSHRRNTSTGSYTPTHLDSIPASPIPPTLTVSPFPPPLYPLPPTPNTASSSSSGLQRPSSRLIQRLRIHSAPSPSPSSSQSQYVNRTPNGTHFPRPITASGSVSVTTSPPATPIAEKITLYQNDPSFLQLHTPVTPPLRPLPPPPEPHPELTSLSPPPRRGSKQISVFEIESEAPAANNDKSPVEGEHKLMSLSRPGSVISLGIVSM